MELSKLKKESYFIVVIIVIILAMVVFILLRGSGAFENKTESNNSTDATDASLIVGKVLEVENDKTLALENKKITVPENWTINTAYQNSEESLLKCAVSSQSNCRVYLITDGDSSVFISSPTVLKQPASPAITSEIKKITLENKEVDFNYEKILGEKRENEEEGGESTKLDDSEKIYYQIYGCIETGICINSSSLSLSLEENKKQVETFENFVKGLKVE